jgi:hypothetical protein
MFVRVLYIIFLGLLVALFVGWAMDSMFPTPKWETEYPDVQQYKDQPMPPSEQELSVLTYDQRVARMQEFDTTKAAYDEWKKDYDAKQKEFNTKMETQGRNVALYSLVIAVAVTMASLWYSGKLQIITEGMLLGGIFTLMYSIGWTMARAPRIAVLTVGISLVVTIIVGYMKFVKKSAA